MVQVTIAPSLRWHEEITLLAEKIAEITSRIENDYLNLLIRKCVNVDPMDRCDADSPFVYRILIQMSRDCLRSARRFLETMGYFAIDRTPRKVCPELGEVVFNYHPKIGRVAIVFTLKGICNGHYGKDLSKVLEEKGFEIYISVLLGD